MTSHGADIHAQDTQPKFAWLALHCAGLAAGNESTFALFAGNSEGSSGGQSKVTWWIIAVAVIAGVAAIATGILAAFLVKRKRSPGEEPPKAPEPLLKVGAAAYTPEETPMAGKIRIFPVIDVMSALALCAIHHNNAAEHAEVQDMALPIAFLALLMKYVRPLLTVLGFGLELKCAILSCRMTTSQSACQRPFVPGHCRAATLGMWTASVPGVHRTYQFSQTCDCELLIAE